MSKREFAPSSEDMTCHDMECCRLTKSSFVCQNAISWPWAAAFLVEGHAVTPKRASGVGPPSKQEPRSGGNNQKIIRNNLAAK